MKTMMGASDGHHPQLRIGWVPEKPPRQQRHAGQALHGEAHIDGNPQAAAAWIYGERKSTGLKYKLTKTKF
jgi:hypothetical protein